MLRGAHSIPLTDRWKLDWMFTTNSFAWYHHLASRSRVLDGHQAKNTSLDHLRIYSRPVTDEDHVCQTCGGPPGGQNCDVHLTFLGVRLQRSYQVSPRDVTTEALCHDYQASLRFAIKIYKEKSCIKPYRSRPLIIGDENCYVKNSGLTLPNYVMQDF